MRKIIFLIFISFTLKAQLNIASPLNNAVYQRGAYSQANLTISGSYSAVIVTSIQARLLNASSNVVVPGFDWTIIQANPSKGHFSGILNSVPAGWYKLEVRSLKSGAQQELTSVNRVGVGDVFMIAGQSNGQGYNNNIGSGDGIASTTDQVITHDNGMYCRDIPIPFPSLNQILSTTKLSTASFDSWCYGKLGDLVSTTTGFPVAFFNSGASGSTSANWKESSDGATVNNIFTEQVFCSQFGENGGNSYASAMPYSNFKRGINQYNSMFGIRAILWHQGESDNYLGTVSTATYESNMNYVINKSRTDFGSTIPWVISRASYINNNSSSTIITAQNNLINANNQIFAGPETDGINNNTINDSRDNINLHFKNPVGLIALANAWSAYLNSAFFTSSTPIVANTPPLVSSNIISSTQVTMTATPGYNTYKWIRTDITGDSGIGGNSEGTSNTLTKDSGTYRCWVGTATGNLQISNPINVNSVLSLGLNQTTCTNNQNLSNFKYNYSSNGLGPIEIDKTNGGVADGDGVAIVLKGVSYNKGIGMAGNAELEYNITQGVFYKMRGKLGIGDEVSSGCNSTGGIIFKVYGDGNLIYTSPTVFRNSAVIDLNVVIFSYSKIKITTTEVATNTTCNRAVWADMILDCYAVDNEAPTAPTNLAVSDTLTKCLTFTWGGSTDNIIMQGYRVYNDTLLTTLGSGALSYTMTGLSVNAISTVNFSIEAFDQANNVSTRVYLTASTVLTKVDYGFDNYFCANRTYFPIVKTPSGGVFSFILPKGDINATLNSGTGAYFSPTNEGVSDMIYKVKEGNSACFSSNVFNLGTVSQPTITPVITTDKSIINIGTTVNLTSTACDGTSTLLWSFNNSNALTQVHSPSDTITYQSRCKKLECYVYSNTKVVNVIPNCKSNYTLTSPSGNLGSNPNSLIFNASQSISASNQIPTTNNVKYQAANSVLLLPGFKVDSGVNFSAKIQNCPN